VLRLCAFKGVRRDATERCPKGLRQSDDLGALLVSTRLRIDRLVAEGAPEGSADRSQLFHGVCWHFAGHGYGIDEIADLFEDHPGGIAQRYHQEGRLLSREVARCLQDHDEFGTEAREILAETEGKRAEKPAHATKTNGAAAPHPEPKIEPEPKQPPQIPSLEAMREELLDLGFTDEEIDRMTPEGAWKRLGHTIEPEQDDFPADDGGDWDEGEDEEDDDDVTVAPPRSKRRGIQIGPGPSEDEEEDPSHPVLREKCVGDWDPDKLPPPREKLLGDTFCKEFVSGVISPGGIGKTTLRILQALALTCGRVDAQNRGISGEVVYQRSRVLLLCLEDSRKEVERRIRAMCKHYQIPLSELKGWLFVDTTDKKLASSDKRNGLQPGDLVKGIRGAVKRRNLDLVIIDPLVDAHELDENTARDMNYVCSMLVRMCIELDIAIDLPQHTRKGAQTPGDPDNSRGSTAIQGKARLNYTLMQMSLKEAELLSIPDEERRSYVRLDSAKVNIAPPSGRARWFKLSGEALGNGTVERPEGDWIQVIEPWEPPAIVEVIAAEGDTVGAILAEIDAGLLDENRTPTGQRYTDQKNARTRAAWPVVQRHIPSASKEACQQWIEKQIGKTLERRPYKDPKSKNDPNNPMPDRGLWRIEKQSNVVRFPGTKPDEDED
jgi:AAA domain